VIYTEKGRGSFFSGSIQDDALRSNLIGVLTPMSSYIYPQIIQGISDTAHKRHHNIVLGSSNDDREQELKYVEQFLQRNIDGLIIEPTGGVEHFQDSVLFHRLKALPIPVVFMDWVIDDPDVSYVSLDDVAGGFRATSYLIEAGHRRIACVYPSDNIPGPRRYRGYRKALEKFGVTYDERLDKPVESLKLNVADYIYTLTKSLVNLGEDRPTAIFFYNDRSALSGYAAIRDAGLKIPDDISVVGYDDSELAILADVPLTSVIHPKYQSGKLAADILFDQIEHQGQNMPRQMIINPTLAIRDSVKTLKKS
jgi:GntR family transcriptional regulator of arabinose operon